MNYAKTLLVAASLLTSATAIGQTVVVTDDFESYAAGADPLGDWKQRVFKFSDAGCQSFTGAYPDFTQGPAVMKDFFGLASPYYNIGGLDTTSYMSGSKNLIVADQSQDVPDACHQVRVVREFASSAGTNYGEGKVVDYTFSIDVKPNKDTVYPNQASAKFMLYLGFFDINNSYNTVKEVFLPVDLTAGTVTLSETGLNLKAFSNILVQPGIIAQADAGEQAVSNWDNMSVSWVENADAALAEENEACEDTGTIRFDGAFGDAKVTCKTDTYEFPADAESFAGFSDGNRDESLYPFFFPGGGEITFNCSSNSATETQRIRFKFERAPFPNNNPEFFTDWVECPTNASTGLQRLSEVTALDAAGSMSVSVPIRGYSESYDSFLMFLETAGGPSVTVTDVAVTPVDYGDYGPNGPTQNNSSGAEPIPVLPFGGLFGLAVLLGYLGWRKR